MASSIALATSILMLSLLAVDAVNVRLLGEESEQGKGELQLLDFDVWTQLCAGSLGPIEGQLACLELGHRLLQRLGTVEEPAEAENFFKVTLVECAKRLADVYPGVVSSLAKCNYKYGPCDSAVYLECSNTSADIGAVLVSVNFSMTFTLVSPEDNVYVEDCLATKPLNCSGLYHFQKTRLPVLQSLIEKLKTNPSCSGLEPVDFDPCYTEPPTTSSASTLDFMLASSTGIILTLLEMITAVLR